jgi:hypothetical protein
LAINRLMKMFLRSIRLLGDYIVIWSYSCCKKFRWGMLVRLELIIKATHSCLIWKPV